MKEQQIHTQRKYEKEKDDFFFLSGFGERKQSVRKWRELASL